MGEAAPLHKGTQQGRSLRSICVCCALASGAPSANGVSLCIEPTTLFRNTCARAPIHIRALRYYFHRGAHSAVPICQPSHVANRAHPRYKPHGMGRLPGGRSRAEARSLGRHDATGPRTRRPPQACWTKPSSQLGIAQQLAPAHCSSSATSCGKPTLPCVLVHSSLTRRH